MNDYMSKLKNLTPEELAYLAGFIDGDGSINAQIIARKDYQLKFQIRFSISVTQKTKRHWIVLWFHKKIGLGTTRQRPDGISEYCLVGSDSVVPFLQALMPYLKVKRRQAVLVTEIAQKLSKKQNPQSFLKLCEQVDTIALLNDSKKRTVTASVVENFWKDNH
jgi:hypothetical protein